MVCSSKLALPAVAVAVVAAILTINGCASYTAHPLSEKPGFMPALPVLEVARKDLLLSDGPMQLDPSDGLDPDEAAVLAVINNSDLKVARADAGIATAQAFAAGLLPDPQLALMQDLSNTAGPGSTKAFSIGINYDFVTLLTRSRIRSASEAEVRKANLNLLWQEWQVVAQARTLVIKLLYAQDAMALLQQNRTLFADRYDRTRKAVARGLLTADQATPNLVAVADVNKQIGDLERQASQTRHDLNKLLGIAPDTMIALQKPRTAALSAPGERDVAAALADIGRRRPDLLALRAGYEAEDQRYRAAILAQFPALNIGLTRARDNANVFATSFGATLSLPVFSGNRGNIKIEEATREKLHAEYQMRLDASISDVHRAMEDLHISQRQLARLQEELPSLAQAASRAERAYRINSIDALTFATVRGSLLARQLEQASLQEAIWEQQLVVQTLLGGEFSGQAGSSRGTR
jgi:outer membrane protein TolC